MLVVAVFVMIVVAVLVVAVSVLVVEVPVRVVIVVVMLVQVVVVVEGGGRVVVVVAVVVQSHSSCEPPNTIPIKRISRKLLCCVSLLPVPRKTASSNSAVSLPLSVSWRNAGNACASATLFT